MKKKVTMSHHYGSGKAAPKGKTLSKVVGKPVGAVEPKSFGRKKMTHSY